MSNDKNTLDDLPEIAVEFSRIVDVTTVPSKGRHYKYDASEAEHAALATRYGVESVMALQAECDLIPGRKGEYKLKASFTATITQACSISLDPVTEDVAGNLQVTFRQAPRRVDQEAIEVEFDAEEEDFELLSSQEVDLGELITQHLSLEINPYPRKPDATGEELGYKIIKEDQLTAMEEKKNPFDVLKSLKHKT
ncbi:YceD family protein [Paremcibacter congregatus]|uniref:DUF177 domain-containing protein n=1 Tax=Paremcibacter congregatus TaxID=2043170 RepID=A0A2G4YN06_9PROT|nr:DUF177 domain-containing protein [Paremcibacter congregatus]PHZ83704.1 hypothetical protein CRD36_15120 [Paremcibacter congregatus]QDE27406.1 DUF177 domain-containing protein [Paremcibacter congregatus]